MPRTLPSFAARLVVAASASAAFLLSASSAEAQPSRRDQPLRTPAAKRPRIKAGALGRVPRPGAAGRNAGGAGKTGKTAKGSAKSGGTAAGGKNGAGADPTAIFRNNPDIKFRPKSSYARVTLNMEDADLPDLVKAISTMTGRRFIYSGKLRQIKSSIIAPGKVTVAEAYQAFLSILEANGMTVIPHGRFLKIVESSGVVSQTTPVLGRATPVPYEDRYITRMYRLSHVDAQEVSGVLTKFKSKDADITVYPASNLLIITDTGANIRRMLRIVEELDSGGAGEQIYMQPVHYRSASELAGTLNEMLDLGGGKAKIVADDANNQLIIVANDDDYGRILEIVKRVDVSDMGTGGIHVLPLQHAQCDELSGTLGQLLGGGGGAARPTAARGRNNNSRNRNNNSRNRSRAGGAARGASGGNNSVFDGEVSVTCDEATNSLITTSSLRDYAQLRNVIDKLDRPRRQVFIEAVIMDVDINHSDELGLGYHGGATADLGGGSDTVFYGGFNPGASLTGVPGNLEALAFGVRGPDLDGTSNLFPTGVSIPGLGVVLHAIAQSGDSNVLATPHVLATDNITAEISIGRNIPLQTNVGGNIGNLLGQAGGAGAGAAGALGGLLGGGLGFQAPRQDVGIKLSITPHINDSDQVRMELLEEFSDEGSPQGTLGAVPINKRTAETTVIVKDQQTVVIGGLVSESQVRSETKIPVLGDIPVLGLLFRNTRQQTLKTNLLLVLTPHIIRGQSDLRRIFERKMQERQEFLDRYFVFGDHLPWEPIHDYSRTNGLLEHIRQTQLKIGERDRLAAEMKPKLQKKHERVRAIQLPSTAGASGGGGAKKPAPKKKTTSRPRARSKASTSRRTRFKVPGSTRGRRSRQE